MRAARFTVSIELLAQLLHLPPAARITGAGFDKNGRGVELIVDDPALPEADWPHATVPVVTDERYVWDWGVEP